MQVGTAAVDTGPGTDVTIVNSLSPTLESTTRAKNRRSSKKLVVHRARRPAIQRPCPSETLRQKRHTQYHRLSTSRPLVRLRETPRLPIADRNK